MNSGFSLSLNRPVAAQRRSNSSKSRYALARGSVFTRELPNVQAITATIMVVGTVLSYRAASSWDKKLGAVGGYAVVLALDLVKVRNLSNT